MENRRGISLREGKVLVSGKEILDLVKVSMTFTPDVSEKRRVGDPTPSSRWLGYKVTGSITEYRSTPWLRDIINEYMQSGATPELTIQGVEDDENCDYYDDYGHDIVTATGCVLTGEISLIELDSDGEIKQDNVSFNAKRLIR